MECCLNRVTVCRVSLCKENMLVCQHVVYLNMFVYLRAISVERQLQNDNTLIFRDYSRDAKAIHNFGVDFDMPYELNVVAHEAAVMVVAHFITHNIKKTVNISLLV